MTTQANLLHYKKPIKHKIRTKDDEDKILVKEILSEYESRKLQRRAIESAWRLNVDFFSGRQNMAMTGFGTVIAIPKQFSWQNNQNFNHVAGIIEARLSHILSSEPLNNSAHAGQIREIEKGTAWSEITGTAFYKIAWDTENSKPQISVCSPFEIYPSSTAASGIDELSNLIHASTTKNGDETIEYYEKPSEKFPNGRLVIISKGRLVYKGDLPYINGKNDDRGFPFVIQQSEMAVSSLYGASVVERLIPVQRAYNDIKNRKQEFLNRLACGVLVAEEGSIDLEDLEHDGISPGKIIVYRHGATPPKFLDIGQIPPQLDAEEDRLLKEFEIIGGGVGSVTSDSSSISGVALEIVTQQNDRRMSRIVANVVATIGEINRHIDALNVQFNNTGKV